LTRAINKDREFRRGRWSAYLKRAITRYVNMEGGANKSRSVSAPVGAADDEWNAYVAWKYELINYIKAKRKECR
jgi:hypothetical protein